MVTLVLAAILIPPGTTVRKVTGEKKYVLTDKLKVHGTVEGQQVEVNVPKDIFFIIAGASVNIVQPGDKFAVDFASPRDAMHFIEENLISHQ